MNTHEQFVSLETSRLLKQAGFDWECNHRYSEGHSTNDSEPIYISPRDNWNQDNGRYSAPTQAVAQRWLREAKGYNVQVNFDYFEDTPEAIYSVWSYEIEELTLQAPYPRHTNELQFVFYEAALEAGLQKCLTLLIEKQ